MGRNIDDREIVDLADAVQQAEAVSKGEGLHRPVFGEGVDILNDDAAEGVDTRGDQLRQRIFCNARSVDRADLLCCGWHIEHLDAWRASHELDEGQGAVESGVDAEDDRFHERTTVMSVPTAPIARILRHTPVANISIVPHGTTVTTTVQMFV